MDREAFDTWLERTILALVIGSIAFVTLGFGGVRPSEFIVAWWLTLVILALWIVRIWFAPRFRFLSPPICWAIIPFVGYAIWRYRTADIEFIARQELLQIILCALLFLAVVNNLYSQESTRILSFGLVSLATILAMYGIYQWLRGSNNVWGFPRPMAYFGRASGSFICPNHFAGFLEMILPVAVALTVSGRLKPLIRILLAYASLVLFVGIAASQSRAGWISTALAMLVLFFFLIRQPGKRWIALALLVVVTGAGKWLYSRSLAPRMAQTHVTGHERDIRLRLWVSAWQMWKDHPWVGVGPDHFDYRFRQYREPTDKTQARPGRAHNDFLNTLTDYGAVGFLLVLLPIGIGVWSVVRCWPYVQRTSGEFSQKKSNRAAIVLGASAGLIALLAHSFFDFNMHIPANAILATLLVAMLTTHFRFATERYWFTARWPLAVASTLALLGCMIYLVPQALTRSREVSLLRRAETFPDGSTNRIALLQKAFAVDSKNFETAFAVGEQLRSLAWTGDPEHRARAAEAIPWFERVYRLNKWDATSYIRQGMCLDWLERYDEALPFYQKGIELDPNYWYSHAMMGWHEFQLERYTEARRHVYRSLELVHGAPNSWSWTYLRLCDKLIAEQNARDNAPK